MDKETILREALVISLDLVKLAFIIITIIFLLIIFSDKYKKRPFSKKFVEWTRTWNRNGVFVDEDEDD